jgi:hypothetical protein
MTNTDRAVTIASAVGSVPDFLARELATLNAWRGLTDVWAAAVAERRAAIDAEEREIAERRANIDARMAEYEILAARLAASTTGEKIAAKNREIRADMLLHIVGDQV